MLLGKFGEGSKGGLEVLSRIEGGTVWTVKVVANRGGFENGEDRITVAIDPKSFVPLKLFVRLPGGRLKKVSIHRDIIAYLIIISVNQI